jgi:hypothetical protein
VDASLDHKTVLSRCAEFDVPASLIFSIADIFEDQQYRVCKNIVFCPAIRPTFTGQSPVNT